MEFIVSHWLDLLLILIGLISFIVTFVRTGSVSKALDEELKIFDYLEDINLKYRNVDTCEKASQSFSECIKDYILNTATNELEELPIPKNVQDKIQSFIGTSLELALEKFLPKSRSYDEYCNDLSSVPTDVIADVYQERVEDMASIAESMELAEKYRADFGLPDTASYADIYAAIDKKAQELKAAFNKLVDSSNSLNDNNVNGKEVKNDSKD